MENLINYEYITEYIRNVIPDSSPEMKSMEEYANSNFIPIIFKEVKRFFEFLLPIVNPGKILEIGTAIGYSAMLFATVCKDAHITSIEIDEKRFEEAYENIKKAGLSDRIHLILDDAANVLPYLKTTYDMIFIDAAKGQYHDYYICAKKLLNPGGILIFDNILFKGLPANKNLVNHKHRTIANNLISFNYEVMNDADFTSSILPLGDGMIIARKEK